MCTLFVLERMKCLRCHWPMQRADSSNKLNRWIFHRFNSIDWFFIHLLYVGARAFISVTAFIEEKKWKIIMAHTTCIGNRHFGWVFLNGLNGFDSFQLKIILTFFFVTVINDTKWTKSLGFYSHRKKFTFFHSSKNTLSQILFYLLVRQEVKKKNWMGIAITQVCRFEICNEIVIFYPYSHYVHLIMKSIKMVCTSSCCASDI